MRRSAKGLSRGETIRWKLLPKQSKELRGFWENDRQKLNGLVTPKADCLRWALLNGDAQKQPSGGCVCRRWRDCTHISRSLFSRRSPKAAELWGKSVALTDKKKIQKLVCNFFELVTESTASLETRMVSMEVRSHTEVPRLMMRRRDGAWTCQM